MNVKVILVLCFLPSFTSSVLLRSTTCRPGYYIIDSKSCRKCPKGTFQPNADQTDCKPCPDGTVSMSKGSTKCVKCGRNETPSEFSTECICVVGAAPDQKGNCNLCKPGTFFQEGRVLEESKCVLCYPGTYQPESGQDDCLYCPDGTSAAEGARKCISCPKGQFPLTNGQCGTCPPGQTLFFNRGYCQDCHEGTFKAKAGTDPCIPCPPNASSGSGASKCEPACPEGEAWIEKKGKCGKCSPGRFYDSFRRRCRKCGQGSFMPDENVAAECFKCPVTSFAGKKGSKKCVECPMGQKLLKKRGKKSCGTCPLGTIYNKRDLSCEKCGFNEYSASAHDAFCDRCYRGTYSLPGASSCFACPHGQALLGKTEKCGVCPAGSRYAFYSASCRKCSEGSYQSFPGIEEECRECPQGTTSNKKRTACIGV